MLTSSALVLFMTAPGLAMFYGGLVRKKNVLGVMMQCMFLMGLMTVVWGIYGYSLAFGGGGRQRVHRHGGSCADARLAVRLGRRWRVLDRQTATPDVKLKDAAAMDTMSFPC